MAKVIVADYDGDAAAIWTRDQPNGAEVFRRLKAARLGRSEVQDLHRPARQATRRPARRLANAAGHYAEEGSRRSVAHVTRPDSLLEVRAFKKAAKAGK